MRMNILSDSVQDLHSSLSVANLHFMHLETDRNDAWSLLIGECVTNGDVRTAVVTVAGQGARLNEWRSDRETTIEQQGDAVWLCNDIAQRRLVTPVEGGNMELVMFEVPHWHRRMGPNMTVL